MSKLKSKKGILIFSIIGLFLLGDIFLLTNKKEEEKLSKEEYIQTVLKKDAYSYLPEEAKQYITQIYEETGNVLLTEKNKTLNTPYLNPKYVEYLSYINGNDIKSLDETKYDVVPSDTIIDYTYSENVSLLSNDDIPTNFDLRNVNGNNYVTPIKDQGGTGLCWAFATIGQAESYLLLKNNQTYTKDTAQIFSESQIDYATAFNGVEDYFNAEYGFRQLKLGGGRFEYAINLMQDALSLVDTSWDLFNDTDFSKKELSDVFNSSNSLYEVDSTVNFPILNISELDLDVQENIELKNDYLNTVKKHIMSYGGAYVGTQGPTYNCSAQNIFDKNYYFIIREDEYCSGNAHHAMQIIGWDDDYEYKYCIDNGEHFMYTDNCNNYYQGKGAWILKNSWGTKDRIYDYAYLAYDSLSSEIRLITDLTKSNEKKWNNIYNEVFGNNLYKIGDYYVRDLKLSEVINESEIVSKVKFDSPVQNTNFYLLYSDSNDESDAVVIDEVNAQMPGLYTFDIYDKKIDSLKGTFYIGVDYIDDLNYLGSLFSNLYPRVYTSSNNETIIKTKDATYKNKFTTKNNDDYYLYVYSETKNIPTNDTLNYMLYDLNGNNLSNYLSYEYNNVANNNVKSRLRISSNVETGEYILKTFYNGIEKSESKIILRNIKEIEGTGTKSDPYVITTPDELAMINNNLSSYYILGNDIDLTEATRDKNGIFYNDGKGWIPIGGFDFNIFDGSLDGKGYTIKGLYKNDSYYNGGLFNAIAPVNNYNISIKNINFEDSHIHSKYTILNGSAGYVSYEGVIAGSLSDGLNDYYYIEDDVSIDISNISVTNGYTSGYYYTGGLFGDISSSKKDSIKLNNIFINSRLEGSLSFAYYKGGITGTTSVQNNFETDANLVINNVLNIGEIDTNVYYMSAYSSGGIIGRATGNLELSNVITSTKINHIEHQNPNSISSYPYNYGSVIGKVDYSEYHSGKASLNNVYYTDDFNPVMNGTNVTTNNVLKKSIFDLKKYDLYFNWDNFENNWSVEPVNNVNRIPVLKNLNFKFTKIDDIKMKMDEELNLYNLITPNCNIAKNIDFEIKDNSIVSIDEKGIIKPQKIGETTINIKSYYDGYENDVKINVYEDRNIITFNSNGGSEVESIKAYSNTLIEEPTAPIKKYYKFDGWYIDNGTFNNRYVFDKMPEENITLYAKWSKYKTTITFNTSGGSSVGSITNYAGDKVTSPNNPTKEGYNFDGWYKEKELKNKYTFDIMPESDITLYAKWIEKNTYKINNYKVDNNNKFISSISANTTIDEFKKNIELGDNYSIDVDYKTVNNKKVLYTGGKTKIYKDKKLYLEYTNIVIGDVNGNGNIDIIDYIRIMKDIMGVTKLSGEYMISADVNQNKNIDIIDYIRIMKMIMEEN